jgi:hypothetical protein
MAKSTNGAAPVMKLSDLKLDERNANKGTARGRKALDKSLRDYGAGRSILLDSKGRVIAGNKTLEAARESDLAKDVLIVRTDGSQLVAVQRTDLDLAKDSKAKALAIADNRVAELDLDWDVTELQAIGKDVDLSNFFSEEELASLLTDVARLPERTQELKPKTFVRVLVSVPIECAAEAKGLIDGLALIDGIEIDYSAN